MGVRMPDSCVDESRCGTDVTLWLNGSHPRIEDGTVTRGVCGRSGSDCCYYRSTPIRVKACPGNYYVYEFVKPNVCDAAYCADVSTLSLNTTQTNSTSATSSNINTTDTANNMTFDPCSVYSALDNEWRGTDRGFHTDGFDDTLVEWGGCYDPCNNYTSLDESWRATNKTGGFHCDSSFNWNGWYRLLYNGMSVRMPDSCVNIYRCGTDITLWLNGSHPQIEDGIVTRGVCGNSGSDCCQYASTPIRVKACPGNYYVYEIVRPSFCNTSYCADVTTITSIPTITMTAKSTELTSTPNVGPITSISSIRTTAASTELTSTPNIFKDPCNNYTPLDQPWRATNVTGLNICDSNFNWNGWYRLLYYGMSVRMPDSCVDESRCGTDVTLWLNGSHPQIEDGIVTRGVCGSWGSDCCSYRSTPIRVKACPGNYYVYEFVKPNVCNAAYCADTTNTITSDPCSVYTLLDNDWRRTVTRFYTSFGAFDDTLVEWSGWYRLNLQGKSAQIPESDWCWSLMSCGGYTALLLGGSHPQLQDGIVTRDVYGSYVYSNDSRQCNSYRSNPIQVKACPGNYHVYRLVKPAVSLPMPTYCADSGWPSQCSVREQQIPDPRVKPISLVERWLLPKRRAVVHVAQAVEGTRAADPVLQCQEPAEPLGPPRVDGKKSGDDIPATVNDPCYNYTALDQPWRATNETGWFNCDSSFIWNGWYRLLYNGMSVRMPDSCVNRSRCGTDITLWLNGSHPQIEDGIVTRGVCGRSGSDCCYYRSTPIRVKACPGNIYIYELVRPTFCNSTYCADVNTITPNTNLTSASILSPSNTGTNYLIILYVALGIALCGIATFLAVHFWRRYKRSEVNTENTEEEIYNDAFSPSIYESLPT
ncbi:hypothetical protein AOLI_G00234710 [Acnodon oligacanthus]